MYKIGNAKEEDVQNFKIRSFVPHRPYDGIRRLSIMLVAVNPCTKYYTKWLSLTIPTFIKHTDNMLKTRNKFISISTLKFLGDGWIVLWSSFVYNPGHYHLSRRRPMRKLQRRRPIRTFISVTFGRCQHDVCKPSAKSNRTKMN